MPVTAPAKLIRHHFAFGSPSKSGIFLPFISLPSHGPGTGQLTLKAILSGLCLAAWALKGREWRGAFAANSSAQAGLWQEHPMDEGVPSLWAPSQTSTPPESSLELSRQIKNSLDCKSVNVPFLPLMGWCE